VLQLLKMCFKYCFRLSRHYSREISRIRLLTIKCSLAYASFEVPTAIKMLIVVYLIMAPCGLLSIYRRFCLWVKVQATRLSETSVNTWTLHGMTTQTTNAIHAVGHSTWCLVWQYLFKWNYWFAVLMRQLLQQRSIACSWHRHWQGLDIFQSEAKMEKGFTTRIVMSLFCYSCNYYWFTAKEVVILYAIVGVDRLCGLVVSVEDYK
jgi:hypothetical protein